MRPSLVFSHFYGCSEDQRVHCESNRISWNTYDCYFSWIVQLNPNHTTFAEHECLWWSVPYNATSNIASTGEIMNKNLFAKKGSKENPLDLADFWADLQLPRTPHAHASSMYNRAQDRHKSLVVNRLKSYPGLFFFFFFLDEIKK